MWYRALTNYFTPVTDYYEARVSTVRAAQELFPASPGDAAAVTAAWDLIGAPAAPGRRGPACDPDFAVDASACGAR